ncbi:SET domain-containing protein [Aureobasidium pullulans]|nr:SET domain-containing protein [Aureobasidium pullulans]
MIRDGKQHAWLSLPVDTLPAWAALNSVSFDGIKIGPLPGKEEHGCTVIAKRHLKGGEEPPLMTIPRELILSLERVHEHAKSDSDFRSVLDSLDGFGRFELNFTNAQASTALSSTARGAILTFLLMQSFTACPSAPRKKGISSPFTEYLKYLPMEMLPTFWAPAECDLLTGTTLAPALTAKLNSLNREFEQLREATSSLPWCAEQWWDEVDGILEFDDWLQVDAFYRSRALEYPGVGDCMVPCIDMANHSSGTGTAAIYEVDDQGNAVLLLRDGKTVEENGEITITYGDKKGACEMLFSYGFIEDEMESARELFLDLSIPGDDPLGRAKAAVANCAPGFKIVESGDGVSWDGAYIWLICVNEEDGLSFQIQQTVEGNRELIATWKDEPVHSFEDFRSILEQDPLWDVYHLRAVSVLQERIASQLQDLYGSDDQVDAAQHGDGTNIRERAWHLAKRLRFLESELLEKAYSYYEDEVSWRRGPLSEDLHSFRPDHGVH